MDQKFPQKVYQMIFIQHRNFTLSWVEHEKNFYNHVARLHVWCSLIWVTSSAKGGGGREKRKKNEAAFSNNEK